MPKTQTKAEFLAPAQVVRVKFIGASNTKPSRARIDRLRLTTEASTENVNTICADKTGKAPLPHALDASRLFSWVCDNSADGLRAQLGGPDAWRFLCTADGFDYFERI